MEGSLGFEAKNDYERGSCAGVRIDGVKGVVVLLCLYKCGSTLVVEKFPLLL